MNKNNYSLSETVASDIERIRESWDTLKIISTPSYWQMVNERLPAAPENRIRRMATYLFTVDGQVACSLVKEAIKRDAVNEQKTIRNEE